MDTSNIVADTSKYTFGTPEFFIALALCAAAQGNGEAVEAARRGEDDWVKARWYFHSARSLDYRVKREPLTAYVVVRKCGTPIRNHPLHANRADAEFQLKECRNGVHKPYRIVELVEKLPQ